MQLSVAFDHWDAKHTLVQINLSGAFTLQNRTSTAASDDMPPLGLSRTEFLRCSASKASEFLWHDEKY